MRTQMAIPRPNELGGLKLDLEDIPVEKASAELTAFANNPNIQYRGHFRLPGVPVESATVIALQPLNK